ncbi:beta-1,4-glucuronyltransferase 1-like [Vanessa tameamea]|uniref:Beta-1,4-glucuronyltransferase 1-like n=1 Tax=Vanessa tameamea TaxID=334116 RepID=A0A8B8HEL8_VANTA|nr:beta-1,4-glucuronyltransferase 1-like [Vanessa tameamea]
MSTCIRICGAYSYRLTRRHSTILLIALFIVILTVIFQLYAYKHQEMPNFAAKVGDFDYIPGAFLSGNQPNENASYCQFNYGLPKLIEWRNIQSLTPPEGGNGSSYRVIYNAIQGTAYANNSKYDALTYATQATPEFLYHIAEIARYWDGPISLSVFVPNFDMDITMQIMNQLCSCYSAMSKVSLHLFFPKRYPPKMRIPDSYYMTTDIPTTTANISIEDLLRGKLERYRKLNNQTRAQYVQWVRKKKVERMMARMPKRQLFVPQLIFNDCAGIDLFDIPTFRQENHLDYPINVGRNIARNASRTNYFIVSDIELVPSDGLAPKFLTMVRKLMGDKKRDEGRIFSKTVFVVPLFEVERGVEIPRDKDTLVRLINENRAKYFHQKVCAHCQRFPGLQSWLIRPSPSVIEPMLIARREYPYHRWEPLYFGTQNEPWYSEELSWEGRQDKMTQMLEMCLQEYRMVVLDGAFLCHAAASRNGSRDHRAERINHRRYQTIISSFKQKYQNIPKCKLMYGC